MIDYKITRIHNTHDMRKLIPTIARIDEKCYGYKTRYMRPTTTEVLNKNASIYIAHTPDKIIGYMLIEKEPHNTLYLTSIAVLPTIS